MSEIESQSNTNKCVNDTSNSTNTISTESTYFNISIKELKSLIYKVLLVEQYDESEACIIADTLMYAELRGNNQGIMKLISGGLKKNMNCKDIHTVYETPVSCQLSGGIYMFVYIYM